MNDKVKIAIVDNDIDKTVFPNIDIKDVMFDIGERSQYHATFVAGIIIDKLKEYNHKTSYTNVPAYLIEFESDYKAQSKKSVKFFNDLTKNLLDHNFINCSIIIPFLPNDIKYLNLTRLKEAYLKDDAKGLICVAAGNNDFFIPGSTFFPQNTLYSMNIGAFYSNNYFSSTPSVSVMFVEDGVQKSYNTKSNDGHVMSYYYSDLLEFGSHYLNKHFAKFSPGTAKVYKRVEKYLSNGSSYACPAKVGLFARSLHENVDKKLSKHDLINIALHSSRKPLIKKFPDNYENNKLLTYVRSFKENKSAERNGRGHAHSLEFGFGNVNHKSFKNLAKAWIKSKNDIREVEFSLSSKSTHNKGNFVYNFEVKDDFRVQQIQVEYKGVNTTKSSSKIKNTYSVKDLKNLKLVSPSGTISVIYNKLLSPKTNYNRLLKAEHISDVDRNAQKTFFSQPLYGMNKTVQFWGEKKTKGTWQIVSNCELDIKNTKLTFIGNYSKDDHYSYDNDILNVKKPSALTDVNGGVDTVYFTNYTNGKVLVNEVDREIQFMSKYGTSAKIVKIAEGTKIENYVFGPLGGKVLR